MAFSLKLLGGVALEVEGDQVAGPAVQRHRLALLALLSVARSRGQSRDKLMALLWPERDGEHARALLNQAVHTLRRSLGSDALVSAGDDLQFNPNAGTCDVIEFEAAHAAGDLARAAACYGGPFLDGFFLDKAPEFERWAARERDRLAVAQAEVLDRLGEAARQAGRLEEAVRWGRARTAHDPLDSRAALRLMEALEAAGNPAAAVQHAVAHQELLRDELEIDPTPEVLALAERLRHDARMPVRAGKTGERPDPPAASDPLKGREAPWELESGAVPPAKREPRTVPRSRQLLAVVAILFAVVLLASIMRLLPGRSGGSPGTTAGTVDEIARAVARELDRRQQGDTGSHPPALRTGSIAAYESYLRGSDPSLIRSDSGARQGLEYFRRAVALDSNYAAAWAALGRLAYRAGGARTEGEAAVRRALALNDSLAEAHSILGLYRAMANDSSAAEHHLMRAIALEPGRGVHQERLASFYLYIGRTAEALAAVARAQALDPLNPATTAEFARALLANNRCDEALAKLETISDLTPQLLRTPTIAAHCYVRQGRWAEAEGVLRPGVERDEGWLVAWHAYVLAKSGRRTEAMEVQADLRERQRAGRLEAFYLAFVPAALGDADEAFRWLERARVENPTSFFHPGRRIALLDPPFDDLRADPRYEPFRQRVLGQKR